MPAIHVHKLTISTARRHLLREATFALNPGRRMALLGRNGGGKTSLLNVIRAAAISAPPPPHLEVTGGINVTVGTRVAVMPQEIQLSAAGTVEAYLDEMCGPKGRAQSKYTRELRHLQAGRSAPGYTDALQDMQTLEAWDAGRGRAEVLEGLRLSPTLVARPIKTLSGGEATRVALAGVLIAEADFLLLDEPTNNLDIPSQEFLVDWFRSTGMGSLVVTHDRAFLDAAVDEILEIDETAHTLTHFGGSFSEFTEHQRIEFEARVRDHEEREDRRAALIESTRRLAQRAQTFDSMSQNDYYRRRGKKVASMAVAQRTRLEKHLGEIPAPPLPARPRIPVPAVDVRRGVAIQATDLGFGYPADDQMLLIDGLNLRVAFGARVAVVGPNGSGKSTLLRLLLGEIRPDRGQVTLADPLRVAHLRQKPDIGHPAERLVKFARRRLNRSEDDVRELLGKVLFADTVHLRVDQVSMGELRRVELATLLADAPDVLVLDEPTNHLDIPSLDMVEEAIDEYGGTLIAVSHDRRFLEHIHADQVISLGDANGYRRAPW